MNRYSPNEFISLLDNEKSNNCTFCNKQLFINWENIKKGDLDRLDTLGEFADSENYINLHGYRELHPNGTNYWSNDAPIAIAYYPYHESEIKMCPSCNAVFLHYIEYAGHAPQKRLRLARKSLVSTQDA